MAAIFHGSSANYLGFHGNKVMTRESVSLKTGSITAKQWNIPAALNIIPVIGNLIAGIFHIYLGAKSGMDGKLIARGIAECTIIGGMLLAIADGVFTVGRMATKPCSGTVYT